MQVKGLTLPPILTQLLLVSEGGPPFMPGDNHFNDKEVRKAQGRMILERKLTGTTSDQLAEEFRISKKTVERRIREAAREVNVENARDKVATELVGLAINAFRQLLIEGDYNAARDVLQGMGVLPKNGPTQTETTAKVEMTLDQWREMRTRFGTHEASDSEVVAELSPEGDSPLLGEATLVSDDEDVDPPAEGVADPDESREGV